MFKKVTTVLLCLILTGCTSVVVRTFSEPFCSGFLCEGDYTPYKGTGKDLNGIFYENDNLLIIPYFIIDLPFSFTVDTLLLPIDIYTNSDYVVDKFKDLKDDRFQKEILKLKDKKSGEIVSYYGSFKRVPNKDGSIYYRKLMTKNNNHFVIQDFYTQTNNKRTDPINFFQDDNVNNIDPKKFTGIDGAYIEWYDNGQMAQQLFFNKGIKQGEYKYWSEYGLLIEEGNYKNNELDGKYIENYRNGQIRKISYYDMGYEGNRKIWDDKGVLTTEVKLGEPQDDFVYVITYWRDKDNKNREEKLYKNNRLRTKSWDFKTGKLVVESYLKNNKLDGPLTMWDESTGNIKSKLMYKDGELDGVSIYWNTDGTIKEQRLYKANKLEKIFN